MVMLWASTFPCCHVGKAEIEILLMVTSCLLSHFWCLGQPREGRQSPSSERFKTWLDVVLNNLLWVTCLSVGVGQHDFQRFLYHLITNYVPLALFLVFKFLHTAFEWKWAALWINPSFPLENGCGKSSGQRLLWRQLQHLLFARDTQRPWNPELEQQTWKTEDKPQNETEQK